LTCDHLPGIEELICKYRALRNFTSQYCCSTRNWATSTSGSNLIKIPGPISESVQSTHPRAMHRCGHHVGSVMSSAPVRNRLLEALPTKAFKRLLTACELVEINLGDILSEPGERIRDVYFPTDSFVSLVARVAGDLSLEVALVGNEGMVGIPLMLGAYTKSLRVLVQQSGKAWRIKAETFKRMTDTDGSLRRELTKYVVSRLTQIGQNAICANAHSIEARLARRLLMMQDLILISSALLRTRSLACWACDGRSPVSASARVRSGTLSGRSRVLCPVEARSA
jgi:CRP-like cAMP-binding protein